MKWKKFKETIENLGIDDDTEVRFVGDMPGYDMEYDGKFIMSPSGRGYALITFTTRPVYHVSDDMRER